MTYPPGAEPGYRRTPLSAEEKARGEANFAPFVARMLVASGRFRVSADTPDPAAAGKDFWILKKRKTDRCEEPGRQTAEKSRGSVSAREAEPVSCLRKLEEFIASCGMLYARE